MKEKSSFSAKALAVIDESIQNIDFGEIVLVVQDGHIIQIERTEKIIISNQKKTQTGKEKKSIEETSVLRNKILGELSSLKYGQLVIKIKDGKAVQVEKTEKRRFPEVEGIYGDGI
ncbi:YezD family protein [Pelosinus sp. IPA-1]|uniref:YezD family protein n=1 Tax=Pelosinus sp. IPA-1 TaxID=3029569 RepID=UPI0024361F97|nr:YezD family protein [Pelosinus sp. IPA-1]GMA97891.1 hypothetical protein PIPA1_06910 [Pelosinus sp. IPA-1]